MRKEKGERRNEKGGRKGERRNEKGEMRGLSTPSPLRGTRPCLRGRVSHKLKTENYHRASHCPPETGGTSEA